MVNSNYSSIPITDFSDYEQLTSFSESTGDILITVSPDKLRACMTVTRGAKETAPTLKTVISLLTAKDVKSDIDEEKITNSLSTLKEPFSSVANVVVTEGQAPKHGRDARLQCLFSTANPRVKNGDEIAQLEAPTQGECGVDIFGDPITAKKGKSINVRIAEGVGYNQSEGMVIAKQDGYAIVLGDLVSISTKYALQSIDDGFRASVSFNDPDASSGELTELLKNLGITHGVDKQAIDEAMKRGEAKNLVVAEGTRSVEGQDASIEYYFARKEERGLKQGSNGKLAGKNPLAMFSPGEKLLSLCPAVHGTPGVDIFGKEHPIKKVKDITITLGKNVKYQDKEEGINFFGEIRGTPFLAKGMLTVLNEYHVNGDLNPSIGNIEFEGNVYINGNVPNGYRISSDKDIFIKGVVTEANIVSKGDTKVSSGFMGVENAKVACNGNLNTKYIDNTTAEVEGDIKVVTELIAARVFCLGFVDCSRAVVRGGTISALRGIEAAILGHDTQVSTVVIAGEDYNLSRFRETSEVTINSINKEEMEINEDLHKFKNHPERMAHASSQQKEIFKRQLMRLSEIVNQRDELLQQIQSMEQEEASRRKGEILVNQMIYPGTYIRIGGSEYDVREEIKGPIRIVERDGIVFLKPGEQ